MRRTAVLLLLAVTASAQVYTPRVLREGQPDASDLARLARGIYAEARALTPRQKAEAVWRYFLTDGRFVQPGFWYHIAGWAYEEPWGEVLDPLKLLNSYGFGLCYQIAPLLEATWKAGGFASARVWFLTGHTVAEVFYDGAYHYFDSDMMGYNPLADGRVASVHEIEQDGGILTRKLAGPREAGTANVSSPWYPADVRAGAIGGLAELFTTRQDNSLFPFERAPQGHSMDFVLRPGERIVFNYQPESDGLFYLPYQLTSDGWRERPQEIARYNIRTADGPRSQKDDRRWATGRIEYDAPVTADAMQTYEARSPYVIIDARFETDSDGAASLETSSDEGRTWTPAVNGEPATLTRSAHGRRSAVSGIYTYQVRVKLAEGARIRRLRIVTRFQLNPRTLPDLRNGANRMLYSAGDPRLRRELVPGPPLRTTAARIASDGAQALWLPEAGGGELIYHLAVGAPLESVAAGARFLDLSRGLAPDKFTAEVRRVAPLAATAPAASIAWSTSPEGPFRTVWEYVPKLEWRDGVSLDRTLLWPEVDRRIAVNGAAGVYLRYRFRDLGVDSIRFAAESRVASGASPVRLTHTWTEDGEPRTFVRDIAAGVRADAYTVTTSATARIGNRSLIIAAR